MLKEKILDSIDFTVEKFVYPHLRKRYSHVNYVPNFIKIETTNLCNSMCLYCPHKTLKREQGFMDETLFRKIISEVYDLDIPEVHLSNFGEPLLDKSIFKRIEYVKLYVPLSNVVVITNGSLLNKETCEKVIESELDEIQISFDGFSKEHYDKYRQPFKFEQIKNNILRIIRCRNLSGSPLKIRLNVICGEDVSKRMIKCFRVDWENKVDKISFQKLHNWSSADIKKGLTNYNLPCRDIFQYMTVLWNGDVVPCCLDYEGSIILGNLKKESVSDVWFGSKFQQIRKQILVSKIDLPLCKNCSVPMNYKYPYLTFLRVMRKNMQKTSSE